jgi:serine/threonine-protein kinase HipA
VRLARLYDVASALPYDDMYIPRLHMAMKIGGELTASQHGPRNAARSWSSRSRPTRQSSVERWMKRFPS